MTLHRIVIAKHAIIAIVEKITLSLDNDDMAIGVFYFILKIIRHYWSPNSFEIYIGISYILRWSESYLPDRSQYATYEME